MAYRPEKPDKSCYDCALGLLARRDHFIREVTTKLKLRYYEAAEIRETIEKLTESGYLDDWKAAKRYLDEKIRSREGPLKIRAALMAKGIGPSDADAVLAGYRDEKIRENLRAQIQKLSPRITDRQKLVSSLRNRGFHPRMILEEAGL